MTSGRDRAAEWGPIGYALALAARAHRATLQEHLSRLGLHLGQELVIVDLSENPDSTQTALVERLGVEQPTVAKTITRMERAGFLQRSNDERDRRVTRLRLTALGQGVVEDVTAAWAAADATAVARLTERQQRTLASLLHKVDHQPHNEELH